MAKKLSGLDQFFLKAEQLAVDFSLFSDKNKTSSTNQIEGLVSPDAIQRQCEKLKKLDVDQYIEKTVQPSEDKNRLSAKTIIKKIEGEILQEFDHGPLYAVEIRLKFNDLTRRVGIIAQERSVANGVWMPEHHLKAVEISREFTQYSIPIITLIDTPGADAGEEANKKNQAHSISQLIADMANIDLPTLGIVLGNGYSGGAIPLATTNLLLSVRDGVFNTIQPRGLASIARKYDLSWQECAKYVGISSYELFQQGYIDGIIDFTPDKKTTKFENLSKAIVSSILSIESAAQNFVRENDYVFDHYHRSIERFVNPSDNLQDLQKLSHLSLANNPTGHINIFGITYRYLRYLSLRKKLKATSISRYSRLSVGEKPKGDLQKRREQELKMAFSSWLEKPMLIKYDETLNKTYKTFLDRKSHLDDQRGRIAKLIFGDPKENYRQSIKDCQLVFGFYLHNLWKAGSQTNFISLIQHLQSEKDLEVKTDGDISILEVLNQGAIKKGMIKECQNFIMFDLVYDQIIFNLRSIAREAKDYNIIAKDSVAKLLETSIHGAMNKLGSMMSIEDQNEARLKDQFFEWLQRFIRHNQKSKFIKSIEEWKKIVHPRVSEPLFAILTFFFEHLLLDYYESEKGQQAFDGRINLRNIGIKDFWNRLNIAYRDLLIQDIQLREKKQKKSGLDYIQHFFYEFSELNAELMTSDPVAFPGFRISIESALNDNIQPCGIHTGIGRFRSRGLNRKVGIVASNMNFQAGAFDMASALKFCKLLVECAQKRFPVVCFISSGGMQTKEGAGALFSMAIVNDRITRFVRDNDLPIICFGFGDCTGGAQASFVTHPLVQTYYLSGTNMPFAGQIVVPSYLPSTSTLSNYLSRTDGSMNGLVSHPFSKEIDKKLKDIDPDIPVARESIEEVCVRILKGSLVADLPEEDDEHEDAPISKEVKNVLIHARGCTAVKLIRGAHQKNIQVTLVQSDPDMDSIPAEMLKENDRLVCIGGNTPDESYLNAQSVIRIAEQENADSLHPGIGFLSENSNFARLCRNHGINFIGPSAHSMEVMGNKSNAINTAIKSGIPVVPGSHGIITHVDAAIALAKDIGYPVLIKAVHGGGGKGIQIVNNEEEFPRLFSTISAEAKSAFGSGDVYLEKCITSLRHIEVQILRDTHGNTKILGLRDCSVQRNNQKVIEESGSTMLTKKLENEVLSLSRKLADTIDYTGAGTVEYIYDLPSKAVYFMEMNTRLQVEHPVTEMVSGIDIVGAQFDIASGKSIEDLDPKPEGYAMELRITAEKATRKDGKLFFVPHPGDITDFNMPARDDIQLICMVGKGKTITPFYDNMIVQLIARGSDRNDTVQRLLSYLDEVTIKGVCTNIPLLKRILTDEVFLKGKYDTNYLTEFFDRIDSDELIKEIEISSGESQSKIDASTLKIEDSDELKVISPSAGIFYTTPSPSEPNFVNDGDVIKTDATLCLLEAMKLFTTISLESYNNNGSEIYNSAQQYKVVRTIPANGQAVNKGDLMFVIKPVN